MAQLIAGVRIPRHLCPIIRQVTCSSGKSETRVVQKPFGRFRFKCVKCETFESPDKIIVSTGDWLGKPANIKVENNGDIVYVGSSLTVHNTLFFVHEL